MSALATLLRITPSYSHKASSVRGSPSSATFITVTSKSVSDPFKSAASASDSSLCSRRRMRPPSEGDSPPLSDEAPSLPISDDAPSLPSEVSDGGPLSCQSPLPPPGDCESKSPLSSDAPPPEEAPSLHADAAREKDAAVHSAASKPKSLKALFINFPLRHLFAVKSDNSGNNVKCKQKSSRRHGHTARLSYYNTLSRPCQCHKEKIAAARLCRF